MKTFIVTQYGPGSRTIHVQAESKEAVDYAAIRAAVADGEEWEYDLDDVEYMDVEEL